MNQNYNEFKFPQIKAADWKEVFGKNRQQTPSLGKAYDLISKLLRYSPDQRLKPLNVLSHEFFDELREGTVTLPNGQPLPKDLFVFSQEEENSTTPDIMAKLQPRAVGGMGD